MVRKTLTMDSPPLSDSELAIRRCCWIELMR